MTPVLSIEELETVFSTRQGSVPAVRGVSLQVEAGETLGVVGESGSGKSVTFLSAMRLLPANGHVVAGRVLLDGEDVLHASPRELRRLRGRRMGMVFQDSMTSLNPLLTIGRQITESLEAHLGLGRRDARTRAVELLQEVGVPDAPRRLEQYPHQLSGGLRQRAAVAVVLAPDPAVLIADEPTTALDVTIQAQLLELLRREQTERGMALILITHDLGVVARVSDRLAVMYAGRVVEEGAVDEVFARPRHPYTAGLLRSVPRLDSDVLARLPSIPGAPPQLGDRVPGCPFRPRCEYAEARCAEVEPELLARPDDNPAHRAACHVTHDRALVLQ